MLDDVEVCLSEMNKERAVGRRVLDLIDLLNMVEGFKVNVGVAKKKHLDPLRFVSTLCRTVELTWRYEGFGGSDIGTASGTLYHGLIFLFSTLFFVVALFGKWHAFFNKKEVDSGDNTDNK